MLGTEAEPYAFVSSLTADHSRLRRDLFELGQARGRYVWVCEHERCRPDLYDKDPLEIADTLLDRVRTARHYIVLLGGERHGTPIGVGERLSNVSHFEIELFAAAISGRSIRVFVASGFSPGPRMAAVLELLAWALPADRWEGPIPPSEILARVDEFLSASPIEKADARTSRDFGLRKRLVQRFYRERGSSRHLLFLDGSLEPRATPTDLDLVDELMLRSEQTQDQERRLSRLWLALRELMATSPDTTSDTRALLLWNTALGRWASAAAWYGLHAHLFLGGRAALGSVAHVRARLRTLGGRLGVDSTTIAHPAAALASATYSIAKLAPWREQRALYREALAHLEHPERACDSRRSAANLSALRGSILLRLGHPWRAERAYRDALRLRERDGDQAVIGESLSELGFSLLFTFHIREGIELMQRGCALLDTSGDPGFRIRAKKKLAWALHRTGRRIAASALDREARQLAETHRIFDQL